MIYPLTRWKNVKYILLLALGVISVSPLSFSVKVTNPLNVKREETVVNINGGGNDFFQSKDLMEFTKMNFSNIL